jgi:hypothetical protein
MVKKAVIALLALTSLIGEAEQLVFDEYLQEFARQSVKMNGLNYTAWDKYHVQFATLLYPFCHVEDIGVFKTQVLHDFSDRNSDADCVINAASSAARQIYVDWRWKSWKKEYQELVFFHELGHCTLYLDHDEELISVEGRNIPRSIMTHSQLGWRDYLLSRGYYLRELFKKPKWISKK